MKLAPITSTPKHATYDVVIVGGAMIGSSIAWFLSDNSDFDGRILVVEMDPSYSACSTAHTNSCIRQQFSTELNVRISQYGVEFLKNFRENLGGDPEIPDITLQSFGYMYMAGDEALAKVLRESQQLQASLGAGTRIMTPEQIAEEYPFYNLDGIVLGSHNPVNEGYFDGATMFDWWRRKARQNGVEYISNEVTAIGRSNGRVDSITLKNGETVAAGKIINASGPRAARTAQMAGLDLPVEPRRRYTFIFDVETPLGGELPLTIDPSGVHVRTDGQYYLCGCPPDDDQAVEFDDFHLDHAVFEEKIWPAIANRVPHFEAVKVINSWVGHYAYNTLDQNAIIGPHPEVTNFYFANGFSGHGFQQSAATGRAIMEQVVYGEYRELDMSDLGYKRIARGEPYLEKAII